MKTLKAICMVGAIGALLLMTGFDCPECNYTAQFTALCVCLAVALVSGIIIAKLEERK